VTRLIFSSMCSPSVSHASFCRTHSCRHPFARCLRYAHGLGTAHNLVSLIFVVICSRDARPCASQRRKPHADGGSGMCPAVASASYLLPLKFHSRSSLAEAIDAAESRGSLEGGASISVPSLHKNKISTRREIRKKNGVDFMGMLSLLVAIHTRQTSQIIIYNCCCTCSTLLCSQKAEALRSVASAAALPLEANEPDDGRPSQPGPNVELTQHNASIQRSLAKRLNPNKPHLHDPVNALFHGHCCRISKVPLRFADQGE
jgi:hypothetical protein